MNCEYSDVYWKLVNDNLKSLCHDKLVGVLGIGKNLCRFCPQEFKSNCSAIRVQIEENVFILDREEKDK